MFYMNCDEYTRFRLYVCTLFTRTCYTVITLYASHGLYPVVCRIHAEIDTLKNMLHIAIQYCDEITHLIIFLVKTPFDRN